MIAALGKVLASVIVIFLVIGTCIVSVFGPLNETGTVVLRLAIGAGFALTGVLAGMVVRKWHLPFLTGFFAVIIALAGLGLYTRWLIGLFMPVSGTTGPGIDVLVLPYAAFGATLFGFLVMAVVNASHGGPDHDGPLPTYEDVLQFIEENELFADPGDLADLAGRKSGLKCRICRNDYTGIEGDDGNWRNRWVRCARVHGHLFHAYDFERAEWRCPIDRSLLYDPRTISDESETEPKTPYRLANTVLGVCALASIALFVLLMVRGPGQPGGAIQVATQPAGALVQVRNPGQTDFEAVGETSPCRVEVTGPGKARLRFTLAGYRDSTLIIDTGSKMPGEINVALVPLREVGWLAVTAFPSDAVLGVRPADTEDPFGEIPSGEWPLVAELAPGEWDVQASLAGHGDLVERATVALGDTVSLKLELTPVTLEEEVDATVAPTSPPVAPEPEVEIPDGFVSVSIWPGGMVYVDGGDEPVAEGRLVVVPVPGGRTATVRVVNEKIFGHRVEEVEVAPNDTISLEDIDWTVGSLSLAADISARFSIDGIDTGLQSPCLVRAIAQGNHVVCPEKEGFVCRAGWDITAGMSAKVALTPVENAAGNVCFEVMIVGEQKRALLFEFRPER